MSNCASKPENLYVSSYFDHFKMTRGGIFLAHAEVARPITRIIKARARPLDSHDPVDGDHKRWISILRKIMMNKRENLNVETFQTDPDIIPRNLHKKIIIEFRNQQNLTPKTMMKLRKAMARKQKFVRYWGFLLLESDRWSRHFSTRTVEQTKTVYDKKTKKKVDITEEILQDRYSSERTLQSQFFIFDLHYKELAWQGSAKDTVNEQKSLDFAPPFPSYWIYNDRSKKNYYPTFPSREDVLKKSFRRYAAYLPEDEQSWWPF